MTKKDEGCVVLPDGSAFATVSFPLPEDHWLYQAYGPPPMGLRCGTKNLLRRELTSLVTEAAKYAVVGATMRGKDTDFDPDALVQNMVVGLLGYFTHDGLSDESWQNPEVVPPEVVGVFLAKRELKVNGENDD